MKEDAPPPRRPPTKRSAIQRPGRVPDVWLAVWASDPNLTEEERQRAQEERDRRKRTQRQRVIGIVADREGSTPEQMSVMIEEVLKLRPTEIHHPFMPRALHAACKRTGATMVLHKDVRDEVKAMRDVVLASDTVIVGPRSKVDNRTPAWTIYKVAKHRGVPATVVLPNGTVKGEG